MGALALHHEDMLIPRDVFITPQLFERRKEILVPRHSVTLLRPEDFAAMMPVADRDFESWLEALAIGDERAVAWLRVHVRRRRAATFSSYAETFNTGSGTITGPTNVSAALIRSYGAGGGGGWRNSTFRGGGGGGGGFCENSPAVSVGATLGYSVGVFGAAGGAPGVAGGAGTSTTTASGTAGFSGITHNAGGGAGGALTSNTSAAGGTATGGTSNTTGAVGGQGLAGADGGDCLGTGGGAGAVGGSGLNGSGPGGGGQGGDTDETPATSGGSGRFYVLWS